MLISKVEVELTSYCNARCPGCLRTQLLEKDFSIPLNHLDKEILFQRFEKLNLEGVTIYLCGVLGDPLIHPKILEIIKWFLSKGSRVDISTNASLRSEAFYYELAHLSSSTKRLVLHFAVDGLEDTNFIYRVNTDYQLIKKNMMAYSKAKGIGTWVFIEFDHNFHQKEEAQRQAQSLNFDFLIGRAIRNEIAQWDTISHNKTYTISHKKGKPHSRIEEYKKIINQTHWDPFSISCLFLHKKRFFLASNGTVWPCCYLWDEYISKRNDFYKRMDEDFSDKSWNSIYKHDFHIIFQSDFYQNLFSLWEEKNKRFTKRCYKACSDKGMLRTQYSKN